MCYTVRVVICIILENCVMEFKVNGRTYRLDVVEVRDQYVMWGIQWNGQTIEKFLKRCVISKVTQQGIDYVAVHDPYYQKITYHRVEFVYVHRF